MTDYDLFKDLPPCPPDPHEGMARSLLGLIQRAKSHGMEVEFLSFVLRDLNVTEEQLEDAIGYAACEWDL